MQIKQSPKVINEHFINLQNKVTIGWVGVTLKCEISHVNYLRVAWWAQEVQDTASLSIPNWNLQRWMADEFQV